eukprot:CAMPEP_0177768380 /NCGR_PEP_ID=MMETSP0491_2-20121128/9689_1 /TAXON_ID=63592 /ORGANISM="Tetraselmis chuii, Strain PLY429" /LENGTH=369 /DNA_ID=CAMNT_0019285181 /DNA_START=211 /DNA_END=1320 /DNA_ORIENTATION=+
MLRACACQESRLRLPFQQASIPRALSSAQPFRLPSGGSRVVSKSPRSASTHDRSRTARISAPSALPFAGQSRTIFRRVYELASAVLPWPWSESASGKMDGPQWWDENTVAVVTGANKGIGFEIASLLAGKGLNTVITARNAELGQEAADRITSATGGKAVFQQLDIGDQESIERFATWLENTHGGLTILVNNAGIAYKGSIFGAAELKATLDTNFRGTAAVCERLKGLIPSGGKIVNVGSRGGSLRIVKDAGLRRAFEEADSYAGLDKLAQQFERGVEEGTHAQKGWPNSMYGISKLLEGMYSRLLAKELSGRGVAVNVCCPGWCQTDMSSWGGPKTARQGADTPVWLALRPPDGPTGHMFGEREQISF